LTAEASFERAVVPPRKKKKKKERKSKKEKREKKKKRKKATMNDVKLLHIVLFSPIFQ